MKIAVAKDKPVVYVDMDGVLADLFNYAARLHGVDHYQKMTDEEAEQFFRESDAYHLFSSIPMFSTANQLLKMVCYFAGGYTILSSPMKYDVEGSIRGKREWLDSNIVVPSDAIIFEKNKEKYAVSADGTPNILIDDWSPNIRSWNAAGGKAIKYQADEDSFDDLRVKFLSALT